MKIHLPWHNVTALQLCKEWMTARSRQQSQAEMKQVGCQPWGQAANAGLAVDFRGIKRADKPGWSEAGRG